MSLPKGYKRLEYIQSSGTQYVDTGFIPNQNTRVVMDAQFTSTPTALVALFGARGSSSSQHFVFYNTDSKFYLRFGGGTNNAVSATPTDRNVFDLNKNTLSVGSNSITAATATFSAAQDMYLFAIHDAVENAAGEVRYLASFKLFSCQIYDNGTLVRDFIPCQNASGAVGLWDAANEEFYGNEGTGTFTAGPVVPEIVDESEITELEYIQSSGTQYVDTMFRPNQNTRVIMDARFLTTPIAHAALFGSRNGDSKEFWIYYRYSESKFCHRYGNTAANNLVSGNPLLQNTFDANKNVLTIGENSVLATAATFEAECNLYLFAVNNVGTVQYLSTYQLSASQIYDNGLLERDYIPAMLSSGEIGLYDRVFHEFYRNAGTGDFIAGPVKITAPKTPANFRVESTEGERVTLAWNASETALGYRLYRAGALLTDTTETTATVTVEPFAGAVFTVTAYNENGEGAGATLTHYSIPENPLLYLITDRTAQDVAERNPKGYYAASDLNRVGYAMNYVAERITAQGHVISVSPKLNWTDAGWVSTADAVAYLKDLTTLRGAVAVLSSTPTVPADMEGFTFSEANDIELILLAVDQLLTLILNNLLYAGEVFAGEV